MSNNLDANTMVVYARRRNGTLKLLDAALSTGGKGAEINVGMGFDPLFSANSVVITPDNKFVLAVNAGSSSVSVLEVQPDFSLLLVHVQPVAGLGPTSIAVSGNLVYVSSPDADGQFDDVFSQKGVLTGSVCLVAENCNLFQKVRDYSLSAQPPSSSRLIAALWLSLTCFLASMLFERALSTKSWSSVWTSSATSARLRCLQQPQPS